MAADVYEESTAQTTAGRREKQASIKVFPVLEGYIKHGSLYRTLVLSAITGMNIQPNLIL